MNSRKPDERANVRRRTAISAPWSSNRGRGYCHVADILALEQGREHHVAHPMMRTSKVPTEAHRFIGDLALQSQLHRTGRGAGVSFVLLRG